MITKRPTTRGRGVAATITAAGLAVGLLANAAPAQAATTWTVNAFTNANQQRKPLHAVNLDVAVPGNLPEMKNLTQGDDVPGYQARVTCYDLSGKEVVRLSGPLAVARIDNLLFSKVVHLTLPPADIPVGKLLTGCTAEVTLPDNRVPTHEASFYGGLFGLSAKVDFNAHYSVKAA